MLAGPSGEVGYGSFAEETEYGQAQTVGFARSRNQKIGLSALAAVVVIAAAGGGAATSSDTASTTPQRTTTTSNGSGAVSDETQYLRVVTQQLRAAQILADDEDLANPGATILLGEDVCALPTEAAQDSWAITTSDDLEAAGWTPDEALTAAIIIKQQATRYLC